MILLLYILFILALFIAIPAFLVLSTIRTFKKRGKKAGFIRLALTLGVFYAGFHYMAFEDQQIIPAWDCKWWYSVQNESSHPNPKVLFEFKKMYASYIIDPADWHNETDFDGEGHIGGSFYAKNVGYEFSRVIVPDGIKAEVVRN